MKNSILIVLMLVVSALGNAQSTDSLSWVKRGELSIGKDNAWAVDVLGNIYIASGKVINKFDSTGIRKFSQSIRSLGRLKEIQPINTMKVVTFSEEQQTICILDNTLTMSEECLDLSNYAIGNASLVAVSGQPDKIWVVDQLNSKLLLLSLGATNQFQEIKNLKGILEMTDISSIQEVNNQLYIVDTQGKIYLFDLYGSLVDVFDCNSCDDVLVHDGIILMLRNNTLVLYTSTQEVFTLPVDGVKEFKISGDIFYFRTEEKIVKYVLRTHS